MWLCTRTSLHSILAYCLPLWLNRRFTGSVVPVMLEWNQRASDLTKDTFLGHFVCLCLCVFKSTPQPNAISVNPLKTHDALNIPKETIKPSKGKLRPEKRDWRPKERWIRDGHYEDDEDCNDENNDDNNCVRRISNVHCKSTACGPYIIVSQVLVFSFLSDNQVLTSPPILAAGWLVWRTEAEPGKGVYWLSQWPFLCHCSREIGGGGVAVL